MMPIACTNRLYNKIDTIFKNSGNSKISEKKK